MKIEELKTRLHANWTTGDYETFARYMEDGARIFYERLGVAPGARLLDVGCGQGFESVTLMAPDRPVVGVDYSADAVAFARERFGAEGLEVTL